MPLQQPNRSRPATALPLFRPRSLQAQREPLHGVVTVVVPPVAWLASLLSVTCLLVLALAAWLVEVPQTAHAVGVLMPADGFVRIVAANSGRVTALHAREGQRIGAGQAIVRVTSDSSAAGGGSVSHARLVSLRAELALRRDVARQEQRARERRTAAISARIAHMANEVRRAETEIGLADERVSLLAGRLDRFRSLAREGNVSGAQVEEARLSWLEARAGAEALRRQSVRIRHERDRLLEEQAVLEDEGALRAMENRILREQLERELPEAEAQVGRELHAPRDGVIARIMVRAGQPVRAGQTLATLYSGTGDLEAWLYIPSRSAGLLRQGQPVEVSFDAWPREIFGTRSAMIVSVSAIALLPSELDVPIALPGPVFEVRAALEAQTMPANGRAWPLAAGTAVSAELLQQRYKLYEWLLQLERDDTGDPYLPADA